MARKSTIHMPSLVEIGFTYGDIKPFFCFFTSRKLPVLKWLFRFLAQQGQTTTPIEVKFGRFPFGPLRHEKFDPNRPVFGESGGKPQIANFCNFFAPQGWIPQPILPKFKEFMRSYSFHIRVKFGKIRFINKREESYNRKTALTAYMTQKRLQLQFCACSVCRAPCIRCSLCQVTLASCFLFVMLGVAYFSLADLSRCLALERCIA